jgi:hypothetical protein
MTTTNLDIDAAMPQDVRDIIHRAETALLSMPSGLTSPAQFAHFASMWIQQAYYIGHMSGTMEAGKRYSDIIDKFTKGQAQ